MTYLSTHWQQILLITVAALTGIREILDICGDNAYDGTLQAIVGFFSQFTTPSQPPKV